MIDRPRLALPLFLLALTALLGGCFADEDGSALERLVGPDTRIVVTDQNNDATSATLAELRAALPFAPVVPTRLPPPTTLLGIQANVAAEPRNASLDPARFASVTLSFRVDDGAGFMIEERLGSNISLDEGTTVSLGKWLGSVEDLPPGPARPGATVLSWAACGLVFSMTASAPQLLRDEAIRIAASTLDAC